MDTLFMRQSAGYCNQITLMVPLTTVFGSASIGHMKAVTDRPSTSITILTDLVIIQKTKQ